MRATLRGLPGIRKTLEEVGGANKGIEALALKVETFDALCALLEKALEEELPADIKVDVKGEGGRVIRTGFDEQFDELRELGRGGKRWILELEASEREKTGISNLKVKYNGAFGYFIEVTKANLHLVPEHYVHEDHDQCGTVLHRRTQTKKEIVNAEERAVAKEQSFFCKVDCPRACR